MWCSWDVRGQLCRALGSPVWLSLFCMGCWLTGGRCSQRSLLLPPQATAEQIRLAQMISDHNDADFEEKVKQVRLVRLILSVGEVTLLCSGSPVLQSPSLSCDAWVHLKNSLIRVVLFTASSFESVRFRIIVTIFKSFLKCFKSPCW